MKSVDRKQMWADGWEYLGFCTDESLLVDGIDVFKHKWNSTGETISIVDIYDQPQALPVYTIYGSSITFAIEEVSNGCWIAIRKTGPSELIKSPYPRRVKQEIPRPTLWWWRYAGFVVLATLLIIVLGFLWPSLVNPLFFGLILSGPIGFFVTPIMVSVSEQSTGSKVVQGFLLTSFQVIVALWAFFGMLI